MVEKLLLKGADKTMLNRDGKMAVELTTNPNIQSLLSASLAVGIN